MSRTYGYYIGQTYTLDNIKKKYPNLQNEIFLIKNDFDLKYLKSIKDIEQFFTKNMSKKQWSDLKKTMEDGIKNQTMHFVLTHQLFKVEFEHNKDTLKALLKMADIKDVSSFVFFVSNSVDNLIKKNSENIDKKYIEKSVGIFENRAKDEKIFKKFESIREIIKNSTNQGNI
jgi:hypothetical protein